ncbi:somatostatin receptor type 5 [Trichinella spiralis]|uniref:somatostatin receptor type 5 n=1 Tax=Trichinella spiralis TaxID=6334 RepID=UPI0001EFC8D7|nr:somatostatin receptor type 5 [Trichinella spiralis]
MRAEQCFLQSNGSEVGENFWKECLRDQARFQLFTTTEAAFFTAAYSIICGVGLLSNGLLIYVLFASLKKRNPGDVFIINLALSNFLLAALYIPFLWLPVNEGDFTHGLFFCKFANALPGSNIFCSTLTIAVMAVDRYYAVVNMNKSQISTRNNYFAILVAGLIWVVALALSLPYLLHYNLLSFRFPLEYALRFNKTEEIILFTTCTLRPQSCVDSGLNAEDEKRCTEQVELVISGFSISGTVVDFGRLLRQADSFFAQSRSTPSAEIARSPQKPPTTTTTNHRQQRRHHRSRSGENPRPKHTCHQAAICHGRQLCACMDAVRSAQLVHPLALFTLDRRHRDESDARRPSIQTDHCPINMHQSYNLWIFEQKFKQTKVKCIKTKVVTQFTPNYLGPSKSNFCSFE